MFWLLIHIVSHTLRQEYIKFVLFFSSFNLFVIVLFLFWVYDSAYFQQALLISFFLFLSCLRLLTQFKMIKSIDISSMRRCILYIYIAFSQINCRAGALAFPTAPAFPNGKREGEKHRPAHDFYSCLQGYYSLLKIILHIKLSHVSHFAGAALSTKTTLSSSLNNR